MQVSNYFPKKKYFVKMMLGLPSDLNMKTKNKSLIKSSLKNLLKFFLYTFK